MLTSKWKTLILSAALVQSPVESFADSDLADYMSASLGMVGVSFTESESTLENTDEEDRGSAPGSGSASILSLELGYHRPIDLKREYFGKFILPFQPTTGNALVFGGGGMNYFFNGQSSDISSEGSGVSLRVTPKFRYYVGGQLGFGYLVYLTESAKKTDLLLDLGVQAGTIYAWKERWGLKAELGIGRGVGTKVSTTGMRIMLGSTYTF